MLKPEVDPTVNEWADAIRARHLRELGIKMSTEDTLLAYSEWLDGEGLVVPDATEDGEADDRSHAELVDAFLEHWESNPSRGTLAGRAPALR